MGILDFDINSIFKKKNSAPTAPKGSKEEKTPINKTVLIRGGIIFVMLIIVFGGYFFILKPTLNSQETKIAQAEGWKQQIQSCMLEIKNLNKSIDVFKEENSIKGALFVSNDEFENFYAELTEATIKSGLRIMDITRGDELPVRLPSDGPKSEYNYTPVSATIPCEKDSKYIQLGNSSSSSSSSVSKDCKGDECNPIAYYKMTVSYKIEGSFGNYLQFRKILANKEKIVNIESETVSKEENNSGRIVANATVSLVKGIK